MSNNKQTPKEKAKELVDKYLNPYLASPIYGIIDDLDMAKECALIAVDEIRKAYPHTYDKETEYTNDGDEITVIKNVRGNNEFWYQVKQEIEKL
jgi:D-alanine-D-alanine ligase-like ATP-grasp enzyme